MYPTEYITNGVGWNGVPEQITQVITKPSGVKEYQVSDHLASLRVAIEGGTARHIDYDPWGTPLSAVAGERQTFNCQEQDRDTRLFDLSDRKLDPAIGGFPSPDRLWEKFRSTSPYAYCANNPLRLTDPSGMQTEDNWPGRGEGGGGDFITPIIAGIRSLFTRAAVAEAGAGVLASDPTIRQRAVEFLRTLAPRVIELGSKLNFLFGQATGNPHNIARSQAMLRQMQSIGLFDSPTTRDYVALQFQRAFQNPGIVQENGRVVRDFILSGPNGCLKVQSIWEGVKLITFMPIGGR